MMVEQNSCLEDVNQMREFEVVVRTLLEEFPQEHVEWFFQYHTQTKKTRTVYKFLIEKTGLSKAVLRSIFKKINRKVEELKPNMLLEIENIKYKELDDFTLKDIINK